MSDFTYHLVVRKGPRPGQIFPLSLDSSVIGRDPMADIIINDAEISRHHARLTSIDDGYEIQDMGSTNGSFVEGERLGGEPVLLKPGQTVALGTNVVLVYQQTDPENDPLSTVVASREDFAGLSAMPPTTAAELEDDTPEEEPVAAESVDSDAGFSDLDMVPSIEDDPFDDDDMGIPGTGPFGEEPVGTPASADLPTAFMDQGDSDDLPDFGAPSDLPDFGDAPPPSPVKPASGGHSPPPPAATGSIVGGEPERGGKKSNQQRMMIIIAVVLLLCCCCAIIGGWQFGDEIIRLFEGL